jgi:5-methylcytosine-specific restriction endonuclease McrA
VKHPVTEKCPVEINHISGDSSDHSPGNLELLCPNCHSLTPTHGSLNNGNGRTHRKRNKDSEK